ncbi:hypothetical protein MTE01_30480 [Microbacterium testaceum]|uniref:Uncharacterized protein n=1 Tax=Microbacterium testaceum TaxID=2033 RepID=A0A4Y3QQZ5_MICTE|nr:hypothetical protein MTE01_30480 [Microbacterium testaceum]
MALEPAAVTPATAAKRRNSVMGPGVPIRGMAMNITAPATATLTASIPNDNPMASPVIILPPPGAIGPYAHSLRPRPAHPGP